ncbi:hypothetical protein ES702_02503 [subsurface metagenome]
MNAHEEKRLRRLEKDLLYWRRAIVRRFEKVNRQRFSPGYAKEILKEVHRDREIVGHIDPLLGSICELLGVPLSTYEELPKNVIQLLPEKEKEDTMVSDFSVKV